MHAENKSKCMHRGLGLRSLWDPKIASHISVCVCATPSLVSPCETYQNPATDPWSGQQD